MRSFLGVSDYDVSAYGRAEIERRYFYHLEFSGNAPAVWQHYETDPSDGSPEPIEFELFWVKYPDEVPELIAGQGEMLPRLTGSS